jgi:hypothetical protein
MPWLPAALEVSASAASVSCAIIAAVGIPLGSVLARGRGPGIDLLSAAAQLPLAMPPPARPRLVVQQLPPPGYPPVLTVEPAGRPFRFVLRKRRGTFQADMAHAAAARPRHSSTARSNALTGIRCARSRVRTSRVARTSSWSNSRQGWYPDTGVLRSPPRPGRLPIWWLPGGVRLSNFHTR